MNRDQVWAATDDQRSTLAGLLVDLPDDEWELASLCSGWRVRDVVAHLALSHTGVAPAALGMLRARGNFHRMVHDTAVRHADAPPSQLLAEIRALAGSRRHVVGTTYLDPLLDVLVHGQDIAIPLKRPLLMPLDASAVAATRVWEMGWPFHARRNHRGLRLLATDVDWTVGDGPAVEGPIRAILLVLTGRPAGLELLSPEGVETYRNRTPQHRTEHLRTTHLTRERTE